MTERKTGSIGTCQTCDTPFVLTHHSQKYCSDDCNPACLTREEIRELIKRYGPRIHLYK